MKHFKWLALIAAAVFAIGFVACTPHGVGPGDEAGIKYYTVTIAAGIENGTVSTDKSTAAKGETVTLTLSAKDDYEFESISVKDASNTEVTTTEVTTTEVTEGSSYTFTMGESNVTVSATFKKKAATPTTYIGTKAPSEAKAVGDIVFSDGSATPYSTDLTLSETQKEAAVAVIYYAGSSAEDVLGAKTLGVGLKNTGTDNTLAWAKDEDVKGFSTDITAIQCTPVGENAATATFSGDLDGSNNWQALCDAVSDEETSGNYPAWEWVNAYATENSLEGSYANGWYLPTVAELSMLYRAKDTVNSALEKAGGTKIADAGYWSSSQFASYGSTAWVCGSTMAACSSTSRTTTNRFVQFVLFNKGAEATDSTIQLFNPFSAPSGRKRGANFFRKERAISPAGSCPFFCVR